MIREMAWAGVLALAVVTVMTWSKVSAGEGPSDYGAIETYLQVLVVEGAPGSEAGQMPEPARVYDGRKWGLSTRWDDSIPNALEIRRKMLENGIRGTFYLNSRSPEEPAGSLAVTLTGNGECSVGGHSVSHPNFRDLPANEIFTQLMANRIALECLTDRPVNSLAFPYGGYEDKARPEVLEGVSQSFLRTGYHHCVYAGFVTANPFLPDGLVSTGLQVVPGDRQVDAEKFWTQIDKIRRFESKSRETSDCIFLGVHPWQVGGELEKLGEVMARLKDYDDFWHCTQTEHAAFARQRGSTKIEPAATGGYTIVRPCAFELGSDIPLTLVFEGGSVRSAKVDGTDCAVRQGDGKTFVNVPHTGGHCMPARIDEMTDGASKEYPGLKASLTFDPATGQVAFSLENGAGGAVSQLLLTVSIPPAFEPGRLRWNRGELAGRDRWSVTAATTQVRKGAFWEQGQPYVAAQLDFLVDGKRGRLFTSCRVGSEGAGR
ncbi:MAG: polysaccharide deacetylase family protein [Thermoguttaceae bacterium]